jgi:hypothetical protein
MSTQRRSQLKQFLFFLCNHLPMPNKEKSFVYTKFHLKQTGLFCCIRCKPCKRRKTKIICIGILRFPWCVCEWICIWRSNTWNDASVPSVLSSREACDISPPRKKMKKISKNKTNFIFLKLFFYGRFLDKFVINVMLLKQNKFIFLNIIWL